MNIGGMEFGGFDTIVFIILGFSAILAFARGFSREIISILALLIGLAGALFIYGRYRVDAQGFIQPSWLADGALFVTVFGVIYLIISFIFKGWAKSIQGRKSGIIDRLMGLAFGLARGAMIASLMVLVASSMAKDGEPAEWMTEATTYPLLRTAADKIQALPFARIKKVGEDIIEEGENTEILPAIPEQDQ